MINDSFVEAIKTALDGALVDLHTSLPAEIVKYENGYATVQILLKKKINDKILDVPPITNVPVLQMACNSGKTGIGYPIKKGDTGLLIFSERSLDIWKIQGGLTDPQNARKHNYSDGVFILGLYPKKIKIKTVNNALNLKNQSMEVNLYDSGKIEIKNNANELIDLLVQTIDAISGIQTVGTPTAQAVNPIYIAEKLVPLKLKLETFKK